MFIRKGTPEDWTYLAVNEGGSVALGITVSGSVVGTGLVELTLATISSHLRKVQRAVHAARKLGDINIKGELSSGELQHLVLLSILLKKVDARSQEGTIGSQLLEEQGIPIGLDSKLGVVRETMLHALLLAGFDIRAGSGIRSLTPDTTVILGGAGLVDGMVERVEDDLVGLLDTTIGLCALPGGDLGVNLWVAVGGLGGGEADEKGTDERKGGARHDCRYWSGWLSIEENAVQRRTTRRDLGLHQTILSYIAMSSGLPPSASKVISHEHQAFSPMSPRQIWTARGQGARRACAPRE